MDPRTLGKIAMTRALSSNGTWAIIGAASVSSLVAGHWWPLLCGAVAEFYWVLWKTKSKRSLDAILREEVERSAAQRDAERANRVRYIETVLGSTVFASWIRASQFPSYLATYRKLASVRDRILRLARDRQEIAEPLERSITEQIEYMLTAYLQFVIARIVYLQSLAGVTVDAGTGEAVSRGGILRSFGGFLSDANAAHDERERSHAHQEWEAVPFPNLADRVSDLERRIQEIRSRAKREPATAQMRERHAQMLEQRIAQLKEFEERDQRAAAQLEMLPDTMDIIASHVSAATVRTGDISTTVASAVSDVREAQAFINEMQPFLDDVMAGRSNLALTEST